MAVGGILAFLGGLAGGIGKSMKDKKEQKKIIESANKETDAYIAEMRAKGEEPDIREIQKLQKQGQIGVQTGMSADEFSSTSLMNRAYDDAKRLQSQREGERNIAMQNMEALLGQQPKFNIPDAANKYSQLMNTLGGMALNVQDKSGGVILPDLSQYMSTATAPDVWSPTGMKSLVGGTDVDAPAKEVDVVLPDPLDEMKRVNPTGIAPYTASAYSKLSSGQDRAAVKDAARGESLMDIINSVRRKRKK